MTVGVNAGEWDDGEILGMGTTASEDAEQSREQAAAALAGIKRNQKDEQKAKKYDNLLADIVTEILENRSYDHIIGQAVPLLERRVSSNMLASVLILLKWSYIQRARVFCGLPEAPEPDYRMPEAPVEYEQELDPGLKKIINVWFETFGKLLTHDVSQRELLRSKQFFSGDNRALLVSCCTHVFGHFLFDHKVHINNTKATSYARFTVEEMEKAIQGQDVEEFFK